MEILILIHKDMVFRLKLLLPKRKKCEHQIHLDIGYILGLSCQTQRAFGFRLIEFCISLIILLREVSPFMQHMFSIKGIIS